MLWNMDSNLASLIITFLILIEGRSTDNILETKLDYKRDLLEIIRLQMKFELQNYTNFNDQQEDISLGQRPLRSLIVSTWKSGSTFLGEIVNATPGNFYHYEPFAKFGAIQIRGPPRSRTALNNIKSMFECDFNPLDNKIYRKYINEAWFRCVSNIQQTGSYKSSRGLCTDLEFTSNICKLFPFHSMKLLRVRLRVIKALLKDKKLNLKVVLLIRDPRGVMHSRLRADFCRNSPDCQQPSVLCEDMISDYKAASNIIQLYPNRLMVLRFEELALQPYRKVRDLYKFLGRKLLDSVNEYLMAHTNRKIRQSSTFRISHMVPFKWKKLLKYSMVNEIQSVCKTAMSLWGYKMAHNNSHLLSEFFNPVEDYIMI